LYPGIHNFWLEVGQSVSGVYILTLRSGQEVLRKKVEFY